MEHQDENVMIEMKEGEKEQVIEDVRDASRDSKEQQSGITSVQEESDADTDDDEDDGYDYALHAIGMGRP